MAGCSATSTSSSSPSFVRKFMDSVVIGSQQQMRQKQPCLLSSEPVHHQEVRDPHAQQHAQQLLKPRVVLCNFEMDIPTNALRIDMSILVSTNDNSSSNLLPRPSVTYKITICTPRRQEAAAAATTTAQEEQRTTTTATTTTFRYSSKFTVAKDIDVNDVPYHEWNGSFALGEKKNTPLQLEDCSFHQVQGIFTANYDDDDTKKKEDNTQRHEDQTTTSTSLSKTRKLKRSYNDIDNPDTDNDDDSLVLPRTKQQHHTNTSKEKTLLNQQQQQQHQ